MSNLLFGVAVLVPLVFLVSMVLFIVALQRIQTTVSRMEAAAKIVAVDLAETASDLRTAAMQRTSLAQQMDAMTIADALVASNLAQSVGRADATEGPDGAAADAALRTGDTAAKITARQDKARGSRKPS